MKVRQKNKMKLFCVGFILGFIISWAYILLGGDYWLFVPLWVKIIAYPGLLVGNTCYDLFGNEPFALLLGTVTIGLFYGVIFVVFHVIWKLIRGK